LISAVGEANDLVIVVDSALRGSVGARVEQTFSTESKWMCGEEAYEILVTTPEDFGNLRNRRHVLLVGTWGNGRVADLVRKNVARVPISDTAEFHITTDVWAARQVVATLMANSPEELIGYIESHGNELLEALLTASCERLADGLCAQEEAAGVRAMLEERYGWSLCLPSGYEFDSGAAEEGFVIFGRRRPDRFVFVRWIDSAEEEGITRDSLIAARDAVCRAYHNGDIVELRRPVLVDTVSFSGRTALRLSGWWGNMELVGGGPFRTYCFYDPDGHRTYIVDVSLFAPGLDKTSLMRSLDAIANTFRPHAP
jgi:hypothetical protein